MDRPEVTQKVIDAFASILDAQDRKGLEKYGESIDAAKHENYDWNLMALEEAADLTKYLVKENQKLDLKIKRYERAFGDLLYRNDWQSANEVEGFIKVVLNHDT